MVAVFACQGGAEVGDNADSVAASPSQKYDEILL
jgi:hypothetical protein